MTAVVGSGVVTTVSGGHLVQSVAEDDSQHLAFRFLVMANIERRRLLTELAEWRRRVGASQIDVARILGTSQSAVARLEAGAGNPRMSTLERHAIVVGALPRIELVGLEGAPTIEDYLGAYRSRDSE